jgi:hypothetical protein
LQVLAWDVSEPLLAVRLIDRGVDNLISDQPSLIKDVVDRYQGLTDVELILLRFRDWMGSATFKQLIKEEPEAEKE